MDKNTCIASIRVGVQIPYVPEGGRGGPHRSPMLGMETG